MGDYFDQSGFDLRFDWGVDGVQSAGPGSAAIVVVDVLSSGTAIDICVANGGAVIPYGRPDGAEGAMADRLRAQLAVRRGEVSAINPFSLSPGTMAGARRGTRILLPSPNGGTVALCAARISGAAVIAGSIRNATAVAIAAVRKGSPVTVIAAGEQWPDGRLRFALEDLIGAGAIAAAIGKTAPSLKASPEAIAAIAAFRDAAPQLHRRMLACASGRELEAIGFAGDIRLAAELDASNAVPTLIEGAFVNDRR